MGLCVLLPIRESPLLPPHLAETQSGFICHFLLSSNHSFQPFFRFSLAKPLGGRLRSHRVCAPPAAAELGAVRGRTSRRLPTRRRALFESGSRGRPRRELGQGQGRERPRRAARERRAREAAHQAGGGAVSGDTDAPQDPSSNPTSFGGPTDNPYPPTLNDPAATLPPLDTLTTTPSGTGNAD